MLDRICNGFASVGDGIEAGLCRELQRIFGGAVLGLSEDCRHAAGAKPVAQGFLAPGISQLLTVQPLALGDARGEGRKLSRLGAVGDPSFPSSPRASPLRV